MGRAEPHVSSIHIVHDEISIVKSILYIGLSTMGNDYNKILSFWCFCKRVTEIDT